MSLRSPWRKKIAPPPPPVTVVPSAVRTLVGQPYAFPSFPPVSFDCWTLVKYVRELHSLPCPLPFNEKAPWCVPEYMPSAIKLAAPHWVIVAEPAQMSMAVMERQHVGVVVDDGVLHALARNASVVWTPMKGILRKWPNTEWWTA
jgi:hypothetical protein